MMHLTHLVENIKVDAAVAQLDANPELWNQYSLRTASYVSPHNKLSDIWVRYRAIEEFDAQHPEQFNEAHESRWYPAWRILTELRPLIFDTMRFVHGEKLGGVLITKIPAGATCEPHIDRGWHATYHEKYAISLKAAPKQKFCFEDGEFESKPGDMWTFDNSFTHWVTNESDTERITLIICVHRS